MRYVPAIQGREGHGPGTWGKDVGEGLRNHAEQETQGEGNWNKETRVHASTPGPAGWEAGWPEGPLTQPPPLQKGYRKEDFLGL